MYKEIIMMVIAVVVIIMVGFVVLDEISKETTFCKGKEGIQVMHKDTSKTYLNCSEYNITNSIMYN